MYSDREKLRDEDLARIGDAFVLGYAYYTDERMRLVTCDFVARSFDPEKALAILAAFANSATTEDQRAPILVGIDTVMMNTVKGTAEWKQAKEMKAALSRIS